MTEVSDFTVISHQPRLFGQTGDMGNPYILGDPPHHRDVTLEFNTHGAVKTALLSMMTRALLVGRARVSINGRDVASLGGYTRVDASEWQFYQFVIEDGVLNSRGGAGGNDLVVHGAPVARPTSANRFHEFYLCNIVCHFHQRA